MPLRWFKRATPGDQIDDLSWTRAIAGLPAVTAMPHPVQARLRALSEQFLREKTISGARGFEVTALVRAAIAVQACLPVLALGLAGYRDFVEIVVYPAQFKVPRRNTDEAGVVHESEEADDWYLSLPLDPYAATDPAEFFAVSGEQFFIDPAALQQAFPDWYRLLCEFFRQVPYAAPDGAAQHG